MTDQPRHPDPRRRRPVRRARRTGPYARAQDADRPPADYLAAVERTDGQCEHVKVLKRAGAKPERCTRTLRGGHRLYLGDDGKLTCQQHYDEARKASKR